MILKMNFPHHQNHFQSKSLIFKGKIVFVSKINKIELYER